MVQRACGVAAMMTVIALWIAGCSKSDNPVTPGLSDPGLVLYLTMDGDAIDYSRYGNNGTPASVAPGFDRSGNFNGALQFNGINSQISIPSASSLQPDSQLTIAFWLRVEGVTNNYSPLFHKGGAATLSLDNREYSMYMKANGPLIYFVFYAAGDSAGQHEIRSSDLAWNSTVWMYFTWVVDRRAHVMKVYVNGTLDSTASDSYSTFNKNDYPLTIANEAETGWPDHSPFKGSMDDFRLYTRALSAGEIRALYLKR
jgi:hypothetical protein